jgi:hypothetical protein
MKNTRDTWSGNVLNDFGWDTAIVLFFLAAEYARAVSPLSIEGVCTVVTIMMVAVMPYFLPSNGSDLSLGEWLVGRGAVGVLGMILGYGLQSSGTSVSAVLGFLPMTCLILAGMCSCYLQFYGLMKLRLAK